MAALWFKSPALHDCTNLDALVGVLGKLLDDVVVVPHTDGQYGQVLTHCDDGEPVESPLLFHPINGNHS